MISRFSSIFISLFILFLSGCATNPASETACEVKRDAHLTVQDCPYGAVKVGRSCSYRRGDFAERTSWYDAMEIAKRENADGYSDWRLPTKDEIIIINTCHNLGKVSYWTSSVSGYPRIAYVFENDKIVEGSMENYNRANVLLVRGGFSFSNIEFQNNFSSIIPAHKEELLTQQADTNLAANRSRLANDAMARANHNENQALRKMQDSSRDNNETPPHKQPQYVCHESGGPFSRADVCGWE